MGTGYGAVGIDHIDIRGIVRYIARQKYHHAQTTMDNRWREFEAIKFHGTDVQEMGEHTLTEMPQHRRNHEAERTLVLRSPAHVQARVLTRVDHVH